MSVRPQTFAQPMPSKASHSSIVQNRLAQLLTLVATLFLAIAFSVAASTGGGLAILLVPNALIAFLGICLLGRQVRSASRPYLLGMLLIYTFAGLPGVFLSVDLDPTPGLLTAMALIVRSAALIVVLPSRGNVKIADIARWTMIGLYLASLFLTLMAVNYLLTTSARIVLEDRLNPRNEWLHANRIGQYAAGLVLSSLLLRQRLWIMVPSVGLAMLVLMLSQSRGSMLALAFGLLAFVMCRQPAKKSRMGWALAGIAVVSASFVLRPTLIAEVTGFGPIAAVLQRTQEHGDSGRTAYILELADRFVDKPLFGYGYKGGSFSYSDRVVFVENAVMSVSLESGIFGTLLYMGCVFGGFFLFYRLAMRKKDDDAAAADGSQLFAQAGFVCFAFLIADGLTEKIHLMQVADTISNTCAILIGCLCFYKESKQGAPVAPAPVEQAGLDPALLAYGNGD